MNNPDDDGLVVSIVFGLDFALIGFLSLESPRALIYNAPP
jgi:hypothetical protein